MRKFYIWAMLNLVALALAFEAAAKVVEGAP